MLKKCVSFLIVLCILTYGMLLCMPKSKGQSIDWIFDLGQFREQTYYRVFSNWLESSSYYEGAPIYLDFNDQSFINPDIVFESLYARIEKDETMTYEVLIETSGLYHISLNFYVLDAFSTAPSIEITINNQILFNELSYYALPVTWDMTQRQDDDRYNRFGNERLPFSMSRTGLYETFIIDTAGRFSEPYAFYLESGVHEISFKSHQQTLGLSHLTLEGKQTLKTYEAYQLEHASVPMANDHIKINGQSFTSKNDIEIKPGYFKGPNMSPSSYKTNVLNMLDGQSMSRSGLMVDYTFTVETSGMYHINLKYLQRDMVGMTSARSIYINGKILFKELEAYTFNYATKWTNHTLKNDDGPFLFYFEQGDHTLSFKVTTSHVMTYIDQLNRVMDDINSLGLAIAQITGQSQDVLIDWNLLRYIPTLKEDLIGYAKTIEIIYDQINDLNTSSKRAPGISTLLIASTQLRRLAKHPNRVANKLAELHIGSGSSYQLIGVAINQLMQQPLSIDRIDVYTETSDLPKAHPNFFRRAFFSIQAFFFSFFDQRYKITANPNDDVLEVWIGQSSLYLDLMQNMIDDEFTKETGIPVRLSVLPNTQRIILNNATNTNPDVVLSIDSWEPYAYALRGMLSDLSSYAGFEDMVQMIHPNLFTPMIFEDGVYGIPETQGLSLLFYRKDILSFLGLEPPDTWDDILSMLPILQSYQMNFFHPLGGEGAYKGFGLTAPFIYQFGGEIYNENGMSTTFNDEKTIEAITFMTDIFNVYNLPQQVPSFFEHFRSGSLPVGIASVDLYLQLKFAAPELAGQWDVLPIPGIYDPETDEVLRWSPAYGKASILFERSQMKDEGFDLIRWWHKKETQLKLLEHVKMLLGERFLFLPANSEALAQSIWDEPLKDVAMIQALWARNPAITPGSYIVERELTNIWNKIVIDQIHPRIAIDQSIPRINRELLRKYEEFGYHKGGVIIHEYIVPRNDNIRKWIPKA